MILWEKLTSWGLHRQVVQILHSQISEAFSNLEISTPQAKNRYGIPLLCVSLILQFVSKMNLSFSFTCMLSTFYWNSSVSFLTDCIEIFNMFLDVFTHYLLIIQVKVMCLTKGHLMNSWCKGLEQNQVNDYQCKIERQLYLYLYTNQIWRNLHLPPQKPTPSSAHTLYNWATVINFLHFYLCLLNFLLCWDDEILRVHMFGHFSDRNSICLEFFVLMVRYQTISPVKCHFWHVEFSKFQFLKFYFVLEHLWNQVADNMWGFHKIPHRNSQDSSKKRALSILI